MMAMTDFDVDAVFQRMHTACDVKNDYQLSKYLNVKASTVKGWKDAKYPPFKACYEIFERTGVTVEWLLSGLEQDVSVVGYTGVPNVEQFIEMYQKSIEGGLISNFIKLGPNTTQDEIEIMARQLYAEMIHDEIIPKGRRGKVVNG